MKILTAIVLVIAGGAFLVVGGLIYLSLTSTKPPLGLQAGRLKPCPSSPNCVCSQDSDAEHHVEPIPYSNPKPLDRMDGVVRDMGGSVKVRTPDYMLVGFTSRVFRFVDDVEFQVDPDPANKVLHCRSASRAGYSDMGVNRRRIEAIRKAFAVQEEAHSDGESKPTPQK